MTWWATSARPSCEASSDASGTATASLRHVQEELHSITSRYERLVELSTAGSIAAVAEGETDDDEEEAEAAHRGGGGGGGGAESAANRV